MLTTCTSLTAYTLIPSEPLDMVDFCVIRCHNSWQKIHSSGNRERNSANHRTTDLPDSDYIKSCYLNARSIRIKFSDLEELVATEKFDTIAITESWLNAKDRDFLAEYNLPGYSIFSCDRENRAESGVILYINNNLYPCAIQAEKINNIDLNSVELRSHNNKVIVCLIYRQPGQSPETDNKLFDAVSKTCCHF